MLTRDAQRREKLSLSRRWASLVVKLIIESGCFQSEKMALCDRSFLRLVPKVIRKDRWGASMHKLRKKRILALVIGIGLMIALPFLLWAGIALSSQSSSLVYTINGWVFTLLMLALEPIIVGAIVGMWVREGSDHPWLRASGFGVLVWWLILFLLVAAAFLWSISQIPATPPDPSYYNRSGPQPGYGVGIFLGASIFYGVAYAVIGLPFILLGAALTYPRRGVAY